VNETETRSASCAAKNDTLCFEMQAKSAFKNCLYFEIQVVLLQVTTKLLLKFKFEQESSPTIHVLCYTYTIGFDEFALERCSKFYNFVARNSHIHKRMFD
jgi:hypothetical protein